LANEEAKHNTEKGPEGIVAKKKKAQGEKIETRSEVRTNSQQLLNWIIQFPKLDHPVSPDSKQRGLSGLPCPGWHQHLVGVLQDSHPA
jgi:hypothetical protein